MSQHTNFDITMTEDEAFQVVATAIKDNPVAEKILKMISRNYHILADENEELHEEVRELKSCL